MATMIPCPACQKKISVETTACPKCGQPVTDEIRDAALKKLAHQKKNGRIGCGVILLLAIGLGTIGTFRSEDNKQDNTFNYLRIGNSDAFVKCAKMVEQSAKHEYKWESSEFKAANILEKDVDGKPLRFSLFGDGVKFQNTFGAYSQMEYICYWDVSKKQIYDFSLQPKNK